MYPDHVIPTNNIILGVEMSSWKVFACAKMNKIIVLRKLSVNELAAFFPNLLRFKNKELRLQRLLDPYGFVSPEVSHDGDCFYESMEMLYRNSGGPTVTVSDLREMVASIVEEKYDGAFLSEMGKSVEEIRNGKEWADDVEISALAEIMDIEIRVFIVEEVNGERELRWVTDMIA